MKKNYLIVPLILLFLFALEGCSLINSLNGFNGRKYRPGIYRHDQAKVESKAGEQAKLVIPAEEIKIIEEQEEDNSNVTAGVDSQIVVIANPLRQAFLPQKKKALEITNQIKSIVKFSEKAASEKETEWMGLTGFICGIAALALIILLLLFLSGAGLSETLIIYFMLYLFALLLAIGGIIFGSKSISKNKKDPSKYNNSFMGYVGKITGIVAAGLLLTIGIIALLIFILVVLLFG